MRFKQALQFGRIGEGKIAAWLKSRGYNVLPVYEKEIHEGKGPQVFTADGGELVAPDMLVFDTRRVLWVEAKRKSVFTWYRIGGVWETGIDKRHYLDYQKVAGASPWPVWLLFLHEQCHSDEPPHNTPCGLFGNNLKYLSAHVSHESDKWGKTGMVYWAHHSLKQLATLEEIAEIGY